MSLWTLGWLAWLLWFAVEEGLALWKGGTPATLSGHVWRWFAIRQSPHSPDPKTRARRFALLAFLAWMVAHFLTGGFF